MESDEDGDFGRRDKFRSERRGFSDGYAASGANAVGLPSRPFRSDTGNGYGAVRRERHSPQRRGDLSPPAKKMRDERYGRDSYFREDSDRGRRHAPSSSSPDDKVQPPMLSFKAFLSTQDDAITDEEAVKKYAEYKLEFKRQQLNEFFVNHKDEEWFRAKYHPDESGRKKQERRASLLKRMAAFLRLWNSSKLCGVSVDGRNADEILRLLDSIVILLEGGSDDDLKALDGEQTEAATLEQSVETRVKEEAKEESSQDKVPDESGNATGDTEKAKFLLGTTSIFLPSLPAGVTKQELEDLFKAYPGYLRVCLSDPDPNRRWQRKGWVSFRRDTKIKEVCFNLNGVRLRDCELGPVVNKDISQRVRTVNGVSVDRKVVLNDLKLASRLIEILDRQWCLWQYAKDQSENGSDKKEEDAPEAHDDATGDSVTASEKRTEHNPLLAEVGQLQLQNQTTEVDQANGETIEIIRDDALIKILDGLVYYLRIVHSVDFYNHSEYAKEDEMPNRCGIIHARADPPAGAVAAAIVDEYCTTFERKMNCLLNPKPELTDEETLKLGMKSEEEEVEKFIQANTQELGQEKWMCPLSGKKFKGAEFVRKHILNKFADKVEEVKKEVSYYNNYLRDTRRPQLPENTKTVVRSASGESKDRPAFNKAPDFRPQRNVYAEGYSRYPQDLGFGYSNGYRGGRYPDRGRPRGGPRYDYAAGGGRPVITYRDLDAPTREFEDFFEY